ncbi:GNAT family N-acetyltransferase [bacterium]|nr:GNAT family N-acetyltransferase [bacterium]
MTPAIRPVAPADIPALRAMLQALSDHDGGSHPVGSEAVLLQAGFGARPLFSALIADEAQGMVIYYPDFSTHRGEPGLYIQDLYVSPEARGTGLARALMAAALRQQDWGARYITLGVSATNSAAIRFYAKTGFTRRGYETLILDGAALKALNPEVST